jgi:hypothetical protein
MVAAGKECTRQVKSSYPTIFKNTEAVEVRDRWFRLRVDGRLRDITVHVTRHWMFRWQSRHRHLTTMTTSCVFLSVCGYPRRSW